MQSGYPDRKSKSSAADSSIPNIPTIGNPEGMQIDLPIGWKSWKVKPRKEGKMANEKPKPNDDRSNVQNPNNPAHEADRINREKQQHVEKGGAKKP